MNPEEDFIIDESIPEANESTAAENKTVSKVESETSEAEDKGSKVERILNKVYRFLSGEFLTKEHFIKQLPFILYIFVLMMLLIASSYKVERTNSQIRKLSKQIELYHTKHIYLKAAITKETKQSTLVEKLKDKGIKESIEPMKKIEISEPKNGKE